MYRTGEYYLYKEHMNLRAQPSTQSVILTTVPMGQSVKVSRVRDNWGETVYDGLRGWVCISECFARPRHVCREEKCEYALAYRELKEKYERLLKATEEIRTILQEACDKTDAM